MIKYNKIIWSPIFEGIEDNLKKLSGVKIIICPFIQKNALEEMLQFSDNLEDIKIITRWNAGDIVSGVSDLSVYPYVKEKGIELYIHPSIHLKLYIFTNDNTAFTSSANVTKKGLGLTNSYNIESGAYIDLTNDDWLLITDLIDNSRLVTDEVYESCLDYKTETKDVIPPLPPLNLPKVKDFSLNSLPEIESPLEFYSLFQTDLIKSRELLLKYNHDIKKYNIKGKLSKKDFFYKLKKEFLSLDLIKSLIIHIKKYQEKQNRRINFGGITVWLQNNCEEKPVPYRSEIKKKVAILLTWLEYFCQDKVKMIKERHTMQIDYIGD